MVGASKILASKGSSAAVGVATAVTLARAMGTEDFGWYSIAITAATVVAVGTTFGFDRLLLRDAGRSGNHRRAVALTFKACAAVLLMSIPVSIGLDIALSKLGIPAGAALLAGAQLVVVSQSRVVLASLQSLGLPVLSQGIDLLIRPGLFLTASLIAIFATGGETVTLAVGLQVAASFSGLVLGIAGISRHNEGTTTATSSLSQVWSDARYVRLPWRDAAGLVLVGASFALFNRVDLLMLGILVGPGAAGIYRVAARGAEVASFGASAVVAVISPRIPMLHYRGNLAEMGALTRAGALTSIGASAAIGILLVALRGAFLSIFGAGFSAASNVLLVLVMAQVLASVGSIPMAALSLTGRHHVVSRALGLGVFVNIVLNFPLAVRFGALGTAGATLAATLMFVTYILAQGKSTKGSRA